MAWGKKIAGDIKYGTNFVGRWWCNNALKQQGNEPFDEEKWLRFVEWVKEILQDDGTGGFQGYREESAEMRMWFQSYKQYKFFFAMLMKFSEDEKLARESFPAKQSQQSYGEAVNEK